MLLVLVHSDAVWTESSCSRGATQGKLVFCHSGGRGGGGGDTGKVCAHTESNTPLKLYNFVCLLAAEGQSDVCVLHCGNMCATVMRMREALLVKLKALVAGGVNTEVEGGSVQQAVSCRGRWHVGVRLIAVSGLSLAAAAVLVAMCGRARAVLSLLVQALVGLCWLGGCTALRHRPQHHLLGESVQLVHLRPWRVHDHQLVLRNVCGSRCQVGGRLGLDALKVHVPTLAFLLLPGHPDEGALHVVVDDFWTASRASLHLLFVGWVSWEGRNNM